MILVVNLNPSLDKIYTLDKLLYGQAVRTNLVQNTAGGKGTHVANVINILGEKCAVTGFLGGYIGKFIRDALAEKGIQDECIHIQAETRSCLNIATADGQQTEVLEPGPYVTSAEQSSFSERYQKLLPECSLVVASGSLPQNISADFYSRLIEMARAAGKKFLLDTSGAALQEGIKAKPYFIKPNRDEIEALTGRKIRSVEDAVQEIKHFQQLGVIMPAVSLGKDGSLVAYQDKVYQALPPRLEAVNAVGSGDSYVAGLAVGLTRGLSWEDTVRLASACGSANVLEAESGFVRREKVAEIRSQVKIIEV